MGSSPISSTRESKVFLVVGWGEGDGGSSGWIAPSLRVTTYECTNVVPRGLEPRTLRLLALRSNQLSYETIEANLRFPTSSQQGQILQGEDWGRMLSLRRLGVGAPRPLFPNVCPQVYVSKVLLPRLYFQVSVSRYLFPGL